MIGTIDRPRITGTYLTPGQKFLSDDHIASCGSREVIVSRVVRDEFGMLHVVLRNRDNVEVSAFVEQIELAIELGMLQPVEDGLTVAAC